MFKDIEFAAEAYEDRDQTSVTKYVTRGASGEVRPELHPLDARESREVFSRH